MQLKMSQTSLYMINSMQLFAINIEYLVWQTRETAIFAPNINKQIIINSHFLINKMVKFPFSVNFIRTDNSDNNHEVLR